MGLGVVGPLGECPSDKWDLRISLVDSRRLQGLARELLSGNKVVASDNRVQLAWSGDGAFRGVIRLRDANARAIWDLEIVLEALPEDQIDQLEAPDPRGAACRLPDAWATVVSETATAWELYNCCVESLFPRTRVGFRD